MIPFLDLKRQHDALSNEIGQRINEVPEIGRYVLGEHVAAPEDSAHLLRAAYPVFYCRSGFVRPGIG